MSFHGISSTILQPVEAEALRFSVTIRDDGGGTAVVHKSGLDARSAEVLRHERDVLARTSHPGVVELAPGAPTADPPVLTTYLAGSATFADRPPRDAASVARLGTQIATTLAELHASGTSHGSVVADHCVIGPGGSVVLCSLRRATAISGPEHPAAARDVTQLIALLRTWQHDLQGRRDRIASALDDVLSDAERRSPSALDLADSLGRMTGPSPRRRERPPQPRREARRRERPAPMDAAMPARHGWHGPAVLIAALLAGMALWRLQVPTGAASGLPPAVGAVIVALRWLALAACVDLAVVGVLHVVASVSGDERVARAADRLAPRRLRRWAAGVTSIGLLGSAVASASTGPARPTTTAQRGPSPTRPPTTTSPSTTTTAPAPPSPSPAPPTPALVATPVAASPSTWTVQRGDHLWSIAERSLRGRVGRAVSEAEVRRYWLALVERNRDRLADPSNPDLIFAGQVFVLPPT
jgi:hypothetical protein